MPPSKTKSFPALILTEAGDVTVGKIQAPPTGVTLASIQAYYKKKKADAIGTYSYKTTTLFMFGVTEGDEEHENKHQLPPPHDSIPFYGDILLLASKDENSFETPIAFKLEDYEQFYTKSFGGFESGEEEDEVVEEKEFVPAEDEEPPEEAEVEEPVEDEEDGEEDGNEEIEEEVVDGEVNQIVTKVKAVKKRKVVVKPSSNPFQGASEAYPNRPILSESEQLQEEPYTSTLPSAHIRVESLAKLTAAFKAHLEPNEILDLETCVYNGTIKEAQRRHVVRSWNYPLFVHLYKMHLRHIASNFHPESYVKNTDLFQLFKDGQSPFNVIAGMNTYELFPSRWRDQFDQQQVREKRQLEGNRSMATDQFLCTRCWKRECTYYEMQTRSADEPMTIFITCINCGKHWRQ